MVDKAAGRAGQDTDLLAARGAKLRFHGLVEGRTLSRCLGCALHLSEDRDGATETDRQKRECGGQPPGPAAGEPKPALLLPNCAPLDSRPASNSRIGESRRSFFLVRSRRFEFRNILTQRNDDVERMGCALAGVVGSQALAQAIGLHPHNRIGVLVEGSSAMENLHSDGILLDLVGLPGKELFAQKRQQMSERGRMRKVL